MPRGHHKSLTLNKLVVEKLDLSSEKVTFLLEKYHKEQESLKKLASKITIIPETVRVYPPGLQQEKK